MDPVIENIARQIRANGGPKWGELPKQEPKAKGFFSAIKRFLGMAEDPQHTHYYERVDGRRIPVAEEERQQIPPIELELFTPEYARRLMKDRQQYRERDVHNIPDLSEV